MAIEAARQGMEPPASATDRECFDVMDSDDEALEGEGKQEGLAEAHSGLAMLSMDLFQLWVAAKRIGSESARSLILGQVGRLQLPEAIARGAEHAE